MCGDKFICIYDDGAIRTINVCVWKNDDYNRFVLLFYFLQTENELSICILDVVDDKYESPIVTFKDF